MCGASPYRSFSRSGFCRPSWPAAIRSVRPRSPTPLAGASRPIAPVVPVRSCASLTPARSWPRSTEFHPSRRVPQRHQMQPLRLRAALTAATVDATAHGDIAISATTPARITASATTRTGAITIHGTTTDGLGNIFLCQAQVQSRREAHRLGRRARSSTSSAWRCWGNVASMTSRQRSIPPRVDTGSRSFRVSTRSSRAATSPLAHRVRRRAPVTT